MHVEVKKFIKNFLANSHLVVVLDKHTLFVLMNREERDLWIQHMLRFLAI